MARNAVQHGGTPAKTGVAGYDAERSETAIL
jgi:hypothetical protein